MENVIEDRKVAELGVVSRAPKTRKVGEQKPEPIHSPSVAILGVLFEPVNSDQALDRVEGMIRSGEPHYIATANVDFLVQAQNDVELRRVLGQADLVLCDGTPVLWASRLLGNPLPERVAGADLVPRLIERAVQRKYRLYFLGGETEVTAKAVSALAQKHPGVQIAGYYSPPFRKLLDMDHEEIARRIQTAEPDLVFVSFGCPKAEKWMAMHYRRLGVPVLIGVGGTIDFIAGEKKRAPLWMQRSGTEWVFRLLQEPRRLGPRYFKDLCQFAPAILNQRWHLGRHNKHDIPSWPEITVTVNEPTWVRVSVPPRFDREVVIRDAAVLSKITEQHCLLEMGSVKAIDSTAIGSLLRLKHILNRKGYQLVLLEPGKQIRRALRCLGLHDSFLFARDIIEAREVIREREEENSVRWHLSKAKGQTTVRYHGEVTTQNAESFWENLQEMMMPPSFGGSVLRIDFSSVRYIDSAGVGIMLRARRFAQKRGIALEFAGLQTDARNVLRISMVEELLTGSSS